MKWPNFGTLDLGVISSYRGVEVPPPAALVVPLPQAVLVARRGLPERVPAEHHPPGRLEGRLDALGRPGRQRLLEERPQHAVRRARHDDPHLAVDAVGGDGQQLEGGAPRGAHAADDDGQQQHGDEHGGAQAEALGGDVREFGRERVRERHDGW